ncbi:hypothetical protein ACSNN9_08235 [Micromonospora sp. URMC 107]
MTDAHGDRVRAVAADARRRFVADRGRVPVAVALGVAAARGTRIR